MSCSYRERRHRILAFVLHPGVAGSAALDGFGLLPNSVSTHRIARSSQGLGAILDRAIRQADPTHVVLGVSRWSTLDHLKLNRAAELHVRAMGLPVVRRALAESEAILGASRRKGQRFELAERIAKNFFPELRSKLPRFPESESHLRPVWHAVLLALHELTRRAPRAAAALVRPNTDLGSFSEYLARCDHRRHPSPL